MPKLINRIRRLLSSAVRWANQLSRINAALLITVVMSGCGEGEVIRRVESVSPDERWVAIEETRLWGGMGAAARNTQIELKQRGTHSPGMLIFDFDEQINGATYVLRWIDATHFEVIYSNSGLVFEALRVGNVFVKARMAAGPQQAE